MPISSALGSSALLPSGLGFRNKIINGGMAISQRGTSAISNLGSVNTYGTDRWHAYGSATSKMTITQSTTNPTGQGFSNSTLITSSAATTPDSGHFYGVRQYIEGYNVADLAWGTAGAKPVVISFWVRSSIAGTYSLALHNASVNRSLVSTYTISAVDTWEKKTIYINAGETTGTWETGNGIGLAVWFDLGSGTAANGTANVWNTSLLTRTSGSVNWIGTSGATFYLTGVQLEQNYQPTPFEQRPYGTELALCQRYYWRTTGDATAVFAGVAFGMFSTAALAEFMIRNPVQMRGPASSVEYSTLRTVDYQTAFAGVPTLYTARTSSFVTSVVSIVSGATQYRPCALEHNNSASAYFGVSAEL